MAKQEGFLIMVLIGPVFIILSGIAVVTLEKQRINDLHKDHNITTAKVTR